MIRGVTVGKFLPPHLGHQYLIDTAKSKCDELTVLICDRPEYLIPIEIRKHWLEVIHPDVKVVVVNDILDDNDSAAWAKATVKLLGFVPDVAFTSEEYGARWAKYMGAKHISVDLNRAKVPISGTKVRDDPWSAWEYLHPEVKAYFVKRICLVGAESTGTTTLTKALARHYKTVWVPEFGRTYSLKQWDRVSTKGWETSDFITIAKIQNRQEDKLAKKANKLLFCDTDSFATTIWHERYMGVRSYEVEALAAGRKYDLYLLTDANIPFIQDGIRDGEAYRQWMHQRFQDKLKFWGKPYVIITGSKSERLKQAIKVIDSLFDQQTVKIPGLVQNAWRPAGGF
jgi:NadR type nicotinamide-nucleotide adenylyltransferase